MKRIVHVTGLALSHCVLKVNLSEVESKMNEKERKNEKKKGKLADEKKILFT